jgi:hypothetical protein
VYVSHCGDVVFRDTGHLTADFGTKTAGFRRKNRRFRAQSDARMRHMCSINGFSSIPTVFDFPANFLALAMRLIAPQDRLDSAAKPPILDA